ncbi:MAG: hypothetical protein JWN15_3425 [Firmicutes bacterium]|nr:hypothetical protein [Bacillota bacterium]
MPRRMRSSRGTEACECRAGTATRLSTAPSETPSRGSCSVEHDVRPLPDRLGETGRQKRIVDDQPQAMFLSDRRHRWRIGPLQERVADALDQQGTGVRPQRAPHGCRLATIDKRRLNPEVATAAIPELKAKAASAPSSAASTPSRLWRVGLPERA